MDGSRIKELTQQASPMNLADIKLVIWDLDGVLWNGVLSERTAEVVEENLQLVRDLTDAGVMCSICSKNDGRQVKRILETHRVWDRFVFPSINWTPKGERVRQIIRAMSLRAENVLFLDDSPANLAEVCAACPGIMAERETVLRELIPYFRTLEKTDRAHIRLQQYKTLERKREFQAAAGSNEDFLRQCGIRVDIKHDCLEHIDRITSLLQRSNQLNFTKVRSTREDVAALLRDGRVRSSYVEVRDRFGDYGIVGFFAVRDHVCIHFAFSCRVLNMGVEQYVFHQLGRPELCVVGAVASRLDGKCPDWINTTGAAPPEPKFEAPKGKKLLLKGPCDLKSMFSFLRKNEQIVTEFTYVNRSGVTIEQRNHTAHIVGGLTLPESVKQRLIETLPFGDADMFRTALFDPDIGAVFYSLFTDPNLGVYREKQSGALVAFGEYVNNLTDESLWDRLVRQEVFTANCRFTRDSLASIKERFEFLGRLSPEEIVANLEVIYRHLPPETRLILDLGGEVEFLANTMDAYRDRHLFHRAMNAKVREWAAGKERVSLIDVNDFLQGQQSMIDSPNHFTKDVYYQMSRVLIELLNEHLPITGRSMLERDVRHTAWRVANRLFPSVLERFQRR